MAFCPECGKPGTANATKCVHCGHEIASRPGAAIGGGRFKGTMMMQSAPAAPAPAAAPIAAPLPIAAPAPSSDAPPKPMLKATMLGAGIAPPVAAAAPLEEKRKMAFAATQPQSAAYVPASVSAQPPPAAAEPVTPAPEPKKYLPGDPMAPTPSAARGSAGRFSAGGAGGAQPSSTTLIVLALVGMLVIAGVGIGAAVYMGLISFK